MMANKGNEPDQSHFKLLSDVELAGLTSKFVPKNTDKTTNGCLRILAIGEKQGMPATVLKVSR